MFKDLKIKNIAFTAIAVVIFCWIVWYLFGRKKSSLESSYDELVKGDGGYEELSEQIVEPEGTLPDFLQLEYKISTEGKKAVFPFELEKMTPDEIELPNRRSLLNTGSKYKYIDVNTGDKIKIVSIQRLSYTIDHEVFTDMFLVTDNDYVIAYSQAKENFKLNK